MIQDYLDKELRIQIKDSRIFQGYLRCIDRDLNIILAESIEHARGEQRVLGHIMVPGDLIVEILAMECV